MSRAKMTWVSALALATMPAWAQIQSSEPVISGGGQGWSIYGGQTVGVGSNVIAAQVGWPGISLTYLYGAARELDFGARLTPFNYGFEGRFDVRTGMKLQGVVRLSLLDAGRFSLGLEFAPGPLIYWLRNDTQWGLAFPIKLQMGLGVGSAMMLNFGIDFPMFVTFNVDPSLYLPILGGVGLEYFIDRRIAITFNVRMGPSIQTSNNTTAFAMDALVGGSYKF
ncbi:MAG TPA: hypothetical protein VE618_01180 [Myxococcaceae bacterium]|nr:hypothetical protein [Myxococcaceae bacterium]